MARRLWTPADIKSASLVGWFSAKDTASIVLDANSAASEYKSKVGNWSIFQTSTAARMPWSATGYNGLPAFLPGSNQWLEATAPASFPTGSAAGTMAGIAPYLTRRGDYTTLMYHGAAAGRQARSTAATGNAVSAGYYGNDVIGNTPWLGFNRMFIQTINGSGLAEQWVDDGPVQSDQKQTLLTPTNAKFFLGKSPNGDVWQNPIRENLWIAGQLSPDERSRLFGYLAWEWNEVASLPSSSAWKLEAPYVDEGASSLPANSYRVNVSTSPSTAAKSSAQPTSSLRDNFASSPPVVARFSLLPSSLFRDNFASSPILSNAKSLILPDSAFQLNVASSPVISNAKSSLTANSTVRDNAATSPTLSVFGSLSINNAYQLNVASSPVVGNARAAGILPDSAYQLNASTSPAIGGARSSVSPSSGYRANAATSPTLSTKSTLQSASSFRQNYASSPVLSAKSVVYPNSTYRSNAATSPTLVLRPVVAPSNTTRFNYATVPTVALGPLPLPPLARTVVSVHVSRVVYSPRHSRLAV